LATLAEGGDLGAIREVADRLDGKPLQAHTGEDGGDITVVIRQIIDVVGGDKEEPSLLLEHEAGKSRAFSISGHYALTYPASSAVVIRQITGDDKQTSSRGRCRLFTEKPLTPK